MACTEMLVQLLWFHKASTVFLTMLAFFFFPHLTAKRVTLQYFQRSPFLCLNYTSSKCEEDVGV